MNPGIVWAGKDPPFGGFVAQGWKNAFVNPPFVNLLNYSTKILKIKSFPWNDVLTLAWAAIFNGCIQFINTSKGQGTIQGSSLSG